VVVAGPELPLHALQKLTRTIPLIGMSEDMVAEGLVDSLARPGSNTTGISLLSPELDGKRQEILIEATPSIRKIAVLADANNITPVALQQLRQAAQRQGVDALMRVVAKRDDVIATIKDVQSSGAQAINFLALPMFSVDAGAFTAQVTNSRLGSIYQWPEDAETGALLGYGPRFTDIRASLISH
jgi:putative tryptophan/tyrosine transport system substrate-binding protein